MTNTLEKLMQAVELKAQAEHLGFFNLAHELQRLITALQYKLGIMDITCQSGSKAAWIERRYYGSTTSINILNCFSLFYNLFNKLCKLN
jgi:hypothetical protein